jgi:magnesium chelatase family protein
MASSYSSILTRAFVGINSPQVQVEIHITNGLPQLSMVGLPEVAVKESRDRVRSAILSSGFELPPKRITLNLAPGDLPKQGSRYDLPIALVILSATGQITLPNEIDDYEFYGELSLNGEIKSVSGLLPSLLAAKKSNKTVIIPDGNLNEASLVEKGKILGAKHLLDVVAFLQQQTQLTTPPLINNFAIKYSEDIADVQGQLQAKRLLEICATGGHSLLMIGEPGSGKSMLATRLLTLLPELTQQQAIETAVIKSISGIPVRAETFMHRQIVAPHHSVTAAALIGGGSGSIIKPGAISLANNSILFLDELPEFRRDVLEALREPLESKKVSISRVNGHATYPANVQLIAACNPTPSGFFADDHLGRCKDTPEQISRYMQKISGPLLDRIDCYLEIKPVSFAQLQTTPQFIVEDSATIRQRVINNRKKQFARQGKLNTELSAKELKASIDLDEPSIKLLENAVNKLGLSARGYHRILKISLTLADMSGDKLNMVHVGEALSYRKLNNNL